MTTKSFHLGDILTVTTGFLVSPDGIYSVCELLTHLTGVGVSTGQVRRVSGECRPHLLAQHHDLADVAVPAGLSGKEDVERWLAEQVARFGEYLDVTPIADRALIGDLT